MQTNGVAITAAAANEDPTTIPTHTMLGDGDGPAGGDASQVQP